METYWRKLSAVRKFIADFLERNENSARLPTGKMLIILCFLLEKLGGTR